MKRHRIIILVILCLLTVIAILFGASDYGSYEKRISGTKLAIVILRSALDEFKKVNARYPESLKELREFGATSQNPKIHKDMVYEYISLPGFKGDATEYKEMNGKGGWFYESINGKIKVNLDKPLKFYMKLLVGKKRDEIPANW